MKKILLFVFFTVLLFAFPAGYVMANDTVDGDELDYSQPSVERPEAYYTQFEGVIEEITGNADGGIRLKVVGEADDVYFNVSDSTVLLDLVTKDFIAVTDLTVGQRIRGAYGTNIPALLSEPPQISPEVIIALSEDGGDSVKVDYFNEEGISSDNGLQLNISDEINAVDYDGAQVAPSNILGNSLVVFYGTTTRSAPPQTSPTKIVVLRPSVMPESSAEEPREITPVTEGEPVAEGGADDSYTLESVLGALTDNDVVVKNGVRYIRLRMVAETLNTDIIWNEDSQTVIFSGGGSEYVFAIGEAEYTVDGMPSTLTDATFIHNDYTYVEEAFFSMLF